MYGLAANGLNPNAVKKIFDLKGRPATNPVILHVSTIEQTSKYAFFDEKAKKLAAQFWPGPLTLLLTKRDIVPDITTAGLSTVGIRSPDNKVFQDMLACLEFPLAAPSANPSNRTSPTSPHQVSEMFGHSCPPILDDGPTELGIESTILNLTSKQPSILRLGHITSAEIETCLDLPVSTLIDSNNLNSKLPHSPGMSKVHYAPRTHAILHKSVQACMEYKGFTSNDLIIFNSLQEMERLHNLPCMATALSKEGDLKIIAKSLFGKLHDADKAKFNQLHLCLNDLNDDLALAINDRMRRACAENT